MRKTVIDGSNTGGFQRTLLLGHDGWIEMPLGKVGIESVILEEDAARIIDKAPGRVVYRLDRLGIPLIEIATAPDMKNPEEVKAVALKIGEIIRACKVKRGIGTIRQDVNVNIKGHDRVEIKGFQDPKMMIKVLDLEVRRQEAEKKKGKKTGEVRNALASGETEFLRPLPGEARMYPETDLPLLRIGKAQVNELKKKLPKLKGEIRDELRKKGIKDEMLNLVIADLDEFNVLMGVYGKDANLVAKMISLWRNEIATKEKKSLEEIKQELSEGVLEKILEALKEGKVEKNDVKRIMEEIAGGKGVDEALKVEKVDVDKVEEEVRKIIKARPGLRGNAYMGLVMKKFKGQVDAKKAMEIVNRIVGEK